MKKQDVVQLMREYDREEKGRVEYQEFMELSRRGVDIWLVTRKYCERDPSEEILKAFKLFDDDNSGSLNSNFKGRQNLAAEAEEDLQGAGGDAAGRRAAGDDRGVRQGRRRADQRGRVHGHNEANHFILNYLCNPPSAFLRSSSSHSRSWTTTPPRPS